MKDSKVNISEFNKRIFFEKKIVETNENGFELDTWVTEKSFWAKVNNLYGKEFWAAKANNFEDVIVFTVRYSKFLENVDRNVFRIRFKNKTFKIISIDNIKYENKRVKIKAINNQGEINE
ncbi:phage head closure protein [Clostridium botulinum C/D]|uniref:phage head closure protein n=1 Tax=Clostridium botulinum TaxID=1491 RepID=UPI0002D52008|nr:phage head closure protein [Clostridium botulinum]KEI02904.1 hypothetical protein Y848_06480 [Clostridium botulinum C/D str. Sp77]KOA76875.1 hypothetical protein ADU78_05305 [Clostridium botulinum]KOA80920.1 hypothetical protein ADU77_00035 [Clostridium botulinum]KOA88980.1 hypothetical protein ADU75_00960 [Clostridium botulinum]KOC31849.1 hypothetical protein ADU83_12030 [Clostridium botulinum]